MSNAMGPRSQPRPRLPEIGSDAEEHINRMAGLVASTLSKKQVREARL